MNQIIPVLNQAFTIFYLLVALFVHHWDKEWKFIVPFLIMLILNFLRMTLLKDHLYKTQQYVITSGLVGFLIINLLLINSNGANYFQQNLISTYYIPYHWLVELCFIIILFVNPKNQNA